MIFRKIYLTREQYTIKSNLSVGDCISPSFSIIIKKSIFFYKRLLETDAINSLLFFKDVLFSLIDEGPGYNLYGYLFIVI